MLEDFPNAELVIYNISPSHAIPATYPLLSNNEIFEDPEYEIEEKSRTFSRGSSDPLTCYRGLGAAVDTDEEEEEVTAAQGALAKPDEDDENVDEPSEIYNPLKSQPLFLAAKALPEELEKVIVEALDELCPPLSSTPALHDKALRIVFSVGIDVMIIDSELSAGIGPLRLVPSDLVTDTDTENVFGNFIIPDLSDIDAEDDSDEDEGIKGI